MAKFKVIEKSRFLDDPQMTEIKGGLTCGSTNPYNSCSGGIAGRVTCAPIGVVGYGVGSCELTFNGFGGCGIGFNYSSCKGDVYFVCGGTSFHRITPNL